MTATDIFAPDGTAPAVIRVDIASQSPAAQGLEGDRTARRKLCEVPLRGSKVHVEGLRFGIQTMLI
ncbi:hypothetical protein [Rhizobium sp. RU20A]|uniref:hypothetical protein n=1 Tax=Rhizobium sp. RU20A TaxID=1907412 RepID=UPI00122CA1E0|nr:hypothetical protein [Rhizobium sp. RU20A]